MPQSCWKLKVLVLLSLQFATGLGAVNFTQCLVDVVDCATNASSPSCASLNINSTVALSFLRTHDGGPVNLTNAADLSAAISYSGCCVSCGRGQETFQWSVFSQEYAAWLLPYLALISQLPFGAKRRMDNLMSAMLTIGSPTLAGYSLYVTFLNARWVNDDLFSGVDYPSPSIRQSVVRVLSSLQQVPLRVHPARTGRFESLVVHPRNDEWWITFAEELDYSHTWSIASATSITWVIVAYLLTVADSLSNVADNINSSGQGTGSGWLWLLPIVVGWLVLSPKCDYKRVSDAYDKANKQVFVADCDDANAPPTQVTANFGLTINPSPDWKLYGKNTTSPDESRIPPVFNYSRTLSWSRTAYVTSLYYRAAWRRWLIGRGAGGNPITVNIHNHATQESRLGTRGQIADYCRPDHHEYPGEGVLWPPSIIRNMLIASLMSLQLQWGTTAAAILVVWFTPTIGLGCRSLAYLLYGALSTLVWVLLVSSSILGYYAHHMMDHLPAADLESTGGYASSTLSSVSPAIGSIDLSKPRRDDAISMHEIHGPIGDASLDGEDVPLNNGLGSDAPSSLNTARLPRDASLGVRMLANVANGLRWLGKGIAIVNAIGIVASTVFQYSNVYDNCYCNSSIIYWGSAAGFNVISPAGSDVDLARKAWIGALALALTCSTFFVGTIYLIRDSLPS